MPEAFLTLSPLSNYTILMSTAHKIVPQGNLWYPGDQLAGYNHIFQIASTQLQEEL